VRIVFSDMARLLRVELDALVLAPSALELAFSERSPTSDTFRATQSELGVFPAQQQAATS
jgi:hypothetical protein